MGLLSNLLNLAGVVFLAHAVYSSYEHSLLTTSTSSAKTPKGKASASSTALPTDIVIEVLFSTTLLVLGIVLSSPTLRPIGWAAWAGQAELDTRRPKGTKRFEGDGGAEGVSMSWLEERKGFYDVRGQRKAFAEWVKTGAKPT